MNFIYNIGIGAYVAGIKLAAACGHRKAKLMEEGRKDWAVRLQAQVDAVKARLGHDPRFIWFHAASLGEFEQGRPLIEALHERYPEYQILQTFFSPSGYEVRKNYKGADVICYLPYDKVDDCRKFLDITHPERAFFVKYEFWGNMLEELYRRAVPTYLVSGIFRPNQVFFKWYGGIMRPVLSLFQYKFVQDEQSAELLRGLGHQHVAVCGDTRFDRVIAIQQQAKVLPWAEEISEVSGCEEVSGSEVSGFRVSGCKPFVLVAGSSWPKDEDIILDHYNRHPEMRLIIAPHEIHEEHVQQIIAKLKRPYLRYSELKKLWEEGKLPEGQLPSAAQANNTLSFGEGQGEAAPCLIIDAIGFLSSIYRYGDVAYIGGGFGVGIHNTLEAAVYGMPVIFGPNHQAFREALGLIDAKGGFPIASAADYERIMNTFMTDSSALKEAGEKAGNYVKEGSGATEMIFKAVFGAK